MAEPNVVKTMLTSIGRGDASEESRLKLWTNLGLATALAIGLGVAVSHGGQITISIAWCGACLGAGALLGFLFGIPGSSARRVVINQPGVATVDTDIGRASGTGGVGVGQAGLPTAQAEASVPEVNLSPQAAPVSPARSNPNPETSGESNLEQVSDWVTKLLVGGGLMQMQQIPSKVWELAAWIAIGIDPASADPRHQAVLQSHQSFAAGLIVYFFVLGFFSGYLITKLQLERRIRF